MRLDQPLPPSRFPAVLAIALALGALLVILILVFGGMRE
jgi:hypothetical protein